MGGRDAEGLAEVLAILATRDGACFHGHRAELLEEAFKVRLRRSRLDEGAYAERLRVDEEERARFVDTALVPVTSFFRDPAVFDALQTTIEGWSEPPPLRAWVIGASTGEEAWSLACVLSAAVPRGTPFEVLATDLNPRSIDLARAGEYEVGATIPTPHLARFERTPDGRWRVGPVLRERVIFAVHDLLGERLAPPEAIVASFDLVLLRNVLIYFTPAAQEAAIERVARVTRPGALLVLGPSEDLATAGRRLFGADPRCAPETRVFRRLPLSDRAGLA